MFVTPGLHYDVILGMPWLKRRQPKIEWDSESVTFNSETCQNHCLESNNRFLITIFSCQRSQKMSKPIPVQEPFQPLENTPISIGAIAFQHLASKPDHKIYSVSLRNIEQALNPKTKTDPATILPKHYKEFLKVFSHEEANKLPRTVQELITPLKCNQALSHQLDHFIVWAGMSSKSSRNI